MWNISISSLYGSLNPEYLLHHLSSRNARLLLGLLTGFSVSILAAGYLLQRRRRRYRAISTTNSSLQRMSTFRTHSRDSSFHHTPNHTPNHTPFRSNVDDEVFPTHSVTSSTTTAEMAPPTEGEGSVASHTLPLVSESTDSVLTTEEEDEERQSVASDDSFHSTVEVMELGSLGDVGQESALYFSAMELVAKGGVQCRNIRSELLCCSDDRDFLAKVHCVRLAFDDLVACESHKTYFVDVGRSLMSAFLQETNQDAGLFVERYDVLTRYLETPEHWDIAKKELTARKVACMNVYDIALDFILLDAFEDLEAPPTTIVAVLQNRWITAGMKTSALSAAIWSISKAKKSMLKHKHGFMAQFYALSETITPTLAWGFLGTDQTLTAKCNSFKSSVLKFCRGIFSREEVSYSSVGSLSDGILRLAHETAQSLDSSSIIQSS